MVGPARHAAASREQFRQLLGRFLTQRNKIHRVAPGGRFLCATRRHHLTNDSRQHSLRALPTDQVEALERLIDEVECVAGVGISAFGRGREQPFCEHGWRGPGRDRSEQGALSGLAMAHVCPTPQPAIEHRRMRPASERRSFPPWRFSVAIRRYPAPAVEQSEIGLLLRQRGQEIGECSEDREAHAPAVAVLRPEQRDLPHDICPRHVGSELTIHGLGDDKADIVSESAREPLTPVRGEISMSERGLHPHLAIADLDQVGRYVVCPQVILGYWLSCRLSAG